MTAPCPKCGGPTEGGRGTTASGAPKDSASCPSCGWSRLVVGMLPGALSDEALAEWAEVIRLHEEGVKNFPEAAARPGGSLLRVEASTLAALVREVQAARRMMRRDLTPLGPQSETAYRAMLADMQSGNGVPHHVPRATCQHDAPPSPHSVTGVCSACLGGGAAS